MTASRISSTTGWLSFAGVVAFVVGNLISKELAMNSPDHKPELPHEAPGPAASSLRQITQPVAPRTRSRPLNPTAPVLNTAAGAIFGAH